MEVEKKVKKKKKEKKIKDKDKEEKKLRKKKKKEERKKRKNKDKLERDLQESLPDLDQLQSKLSAYYAKVEKETAVIKRLALKIPLLNHIATFFSSFFHSFPLTPWRIEFVF